jgi:catechol 2,3-dioxygenase
MSAGAPLDPEELEERQAPVAALLPASTTVGPVELTVTRLERSLAYYRQAIGLQLLALDGIRASLGAGERELVRLVEDAAARSVGRRSGLYHFALLVVLPTEVVNAADGWLVADP